MALYPICGMLNSCSRFWTWSHIQWFMSALYVLREATKGMDMMEATDELEALFKQYPSFDWDEQSKEKTRNEGVLEKN